MMKRKFNFLCGTFERNNYIYAVKFGNHPYHYFKEADSLSSIHDSLPFAVNSLIGKLDKIRTIQVPLSEEESKIYFADGKFVFQGEELKTQLSLTEKLPKPSKTSSLPNKTSQLVFSPGETNPTLFLNKLEKCIDMKTDKDKMYAIRNFVHENHRVEFSEKYFTSNWPTVKKVFLEKYSLSYVENMKRELDIDFKEGTTLRMFVEEKLSAFSTFTTLPLLNQMEMIIKDLPAEVSYQFIKNEKMTGSKQEVLEFCDAIQDLMATMCIATEEESRDKQNLMQNMQNKDVLNQMKEFNFDMELESEISRETDTSYESESSSRNNCRTVRGAKRGRPPKKISESFSNDDSSSQLSHQETDESMSVRDGISRGRGRGRGRGKGEGKIAKRGRPRKKLSTIPEHLLTSNENLNEISDNSNHSYNLRN